MAIRIHQLVLALALTGVAVGVMAQSGSDSAGADTGAPPGSPPAHSWQGGDRGPGGSHGNWGGEGRGGHDWGHGRHGHHHHHHHHHHHRGHGHWGSGGRGHGPGLLFNFRGLDLTPAQREQVHTILSAARQQHANKGPGNKGPSGGVDLLALANPGDPNYGTALQAAKKRAADRIQEFSELQQKLYNVLTPQQKTQLTKNLAERKAKIAQWKAKMEQWKAEHAKGQQGNGQQGAAGNQ